MQTVSVVTISYNNKVGLEQTIPSVAIQTYPNIEYIIVDGGSSDGSVDVIKKYANKVSYWVSEPDKGIYNAMNKALKKTTGDYLLFLNSGDYFCSADVLSLIFKDEHHADLLIGRQKFISANGKVGISPKLHADEIDMEYFLSSTLPHQATFIKRSLLCERGGYDESYRICADWVFWIQAVVEHKCSIEILPQAISYMDNGGISSDMDKCHQDMSRFLQVCLDRKLLTWDMILATAQKARVHDLCIRSKGLKFANKVLAWIGRRI